MILVDDGSDDNSPQMCDSYASIDRRIRVIHQPNKGLGAARNSGIDAAEGECLMFLDSDDASASRHIHAPFRHHGAARGIRLRGISHFPVLRQRPRQSLLSFPPQTFTDKWDYWFNANAYQHSYACNKIFRARVFSDIRFREGKKFEDLHTLPILNVCSQFATTDKGLYYYYDNDDGITATAGKGLSDLLEGHAITGLARLTRLATPCKHQPQSLRDILRPCREHTDGCKRKMRQRKHLSARPALIGTLPNSHNHAHRRHENILQTQQNISQNMEKQPLISFIITAYNIPAELLIECIKSILAMSLSAHEREIIVVDDGSQTPAIATMRQPRRRNHFTYDSATKVYPPLATRV